jgi:glutamate formiminotransferase/formiminotetrahydrofolate cyclodeaminase
MVLERQVRSAVQGGESVSGFVASVASSSPTPGGGSVAAHVGALAAALAQMVAGLTAGRKKYAAVDAEMRDVSLRAAGLVNELSALVSKDATAYSAVSAAYKLPAEPADAAARRKEAITKALLGAADVPLETARASARVAELAQIVAAKGNTNAVSDAGVSALLADAACRGAVYNVRINISALDDRSLGAGLVEEASQLLAQTRTRVDEVLALVERAIG